MLQISSPDNTIIPYHDKIVSKAKKTLEIIHPDFHTSNPIISGSYAINLVYSPESHYNDLDFYFNFEEDFTRAVNLINSNSFFKVICETSNAISYKNDNDLNVQLIKKFFLPPEKLIYKHDFIVASVAIQNEIVYTTLETFKAWSKSELSFRNYQFEDYQDNINKTFIRLNNIVDRLDKYSKRYSLDISSQTFKDLFFIYNKLNSNNFSNRINKIVDHHNNQEPVFDYYGNKVNVSITYMSVLQKLNSFLILESNISGIQPLISTTTNTEFNENILF